MLRHLILGRHLQHCLRRPGLCLGNVIDRLQPCGQVLDGVRADHGGRDGVRPAYNCQHLCGLFREEVADEEEDVEMQGFHQDNRVHLGLPLVEREVQGGIYTQTHH